ncbi:MAG TPA: zf-HC2 domain-containing protein [Pyrinomonadaceae bacterium]|nr:zf-HC2 domain-containing protein [Pyrinomonadaceae bacterium]
MNCEQCQELIHDLIDGSLSQRDESTLNTHLEACLDCDSVRQDLSSIVTYCQMHRGEYEAPPNEQALWLRIRNVIEAETGGRRRAAAQTDTRRPSFVGRLMGHTWELSLAQLASLTAAVVLLVSLTTVIGLRRWGGETVRVAPAYTSNVNDRVWQRNQVINYWNQRVELNKARWSPEMRETFDRNMRVIDEAVANSLNELNRNPHDEVSEQMLNESLNDKLALLKEFSDL